MKIWVLKESVDKKKVKAAIDRYKKKKLALSSEKDQWKSVVNHADSETKKSFRYKDWK